MAGSNSTQTWRHCRGGLTLLRFCVVHGSNSVNFSCPSPEVALRGATKSTRTVTGWRIGITSHITSRTHVFNPIASKSCCYYTVGVTTTYAIRPPTIWCCSCSVALATEFGWGTPLAPRPVERSPLKWYMGGASTPPTTILRNDEAGDGEGLHRYNPDTCT